MKKVSFYALLLVFATALFSCGSEKENTDKKINKEDEKPVEVVDVVVEEPNTFTDSRDNNVYKTVEIDGKTWLAENFAHKTDEGSWAYKNSEDNVAKYGYYYNWDAAMKVVPEGWRLPTKEEFESLIKQAGGGENAFNALVTGGKSGFNGVYAGWYDGTAEPFSGEDTNMSFWSSTEHSQKTYAFYLDLFKHDKAKLAMVSIEKTQGYSLRLIKK